MARPPFALFSLGLVCVLSACAGQQLAQGEQRFHINHIGYDRLAPKRAVVEANGSFDAFEIVDTTTEQPALRGALRPVAGFTEWQGGPMYYVADFSALDRAGTYELRSQGARSAAFPVGDQLLFQTTATAVLQYFRAMRAVETDANIWARDGAAPVFGKSGTRDVRGGWYDASGDVSKYLTHLSYANFLNPQQTPLVAWAMAWVADSAPALLETQGLLVEMQSEAVWGADFLVRMQDPTGFFYATVFDGWSGKAEERKIVAFSGQDGTLNDHYQAAFREGGGMAIAALARVAAWKRDEGAFTAARYLQAAELGFEHLSQHNLEYVDDGKENIIDDYSALLAASELYAATGKASYLEAARLRATQLAARLHASGYFIADGANRPFWHASDAGLPVVALARYQEIETDVSAKASALGAIAKHLKHVVSLTEGVANPYGYARQQVASSAAAFFIPHDNESGYWWQGENARLASVAAAALIGGRVAATAPGEQLGIEKGLGAVAIDQLDWVLGKNPFDTCMLAGFGRNNPVPYANGKPESGTVVGGIANGITSRERGGTGIQWDSPGAREPWQRWRWIEQWIPHAAWYLVGITALASAEAPPAAAPAPTVAPPS